MLNRHHLQFLHQLLGEFPAVAILGPRQVAVTLGGLQGRWSSWGPLPESDGAAFRIERLTKTDLDSSLATVW